MAYIINLTHYLDNTGNIPKSIPAPARRLASFMALVVDEVTRQYPHAASGIETTLRCFKKSCKGTVIGALDDDTKPVCWYCLDCGESGTISNWQHTRWDDTKSLIQPVGKNETT